MDTNTFLTFERRKTSILQQKVAVIERLNALCPLFGVYFKRSRGSTIVTFHMKKNILIEFQHIVLINM